MIKIKSVVGEWHCNFCSNKEGIVEVYSDTPGRTLHTCLCCGCLFDLKNLLNAEWEHRTLSSIG